MHKEAFARFATSKYTLPKNNNIDETFMHLTNYSINKNSTEYIFNSNSSNSNKGHKRHIKHIFE